MDLSGRPLVSGPKQNIITIDGPAGAGKGTITKILGGFLRDRSVAVTVLDSGALYRLCAHLLKKYHVLSSGVINENTRAHLGEIIEALTKDVRIQQGKIYILDRPLCDDVLRTPEIDHIVPMISPYPCIRERVLMFQRAYVPTDIAGVLIAEGRDMGTVVFPDARLKFYLTAPIEIRAQWRFNDLARRNGRTFEEIRNEIQCRDQQDMERKHSPLKKPDDAIEIRSDMYNTPQDVATELLKSWCERTCLSE